MAVEESNVVPFTVLQDTEDVYRIGLEMAIFKFDDPTQIIDVVPRRIEPKALDEIRGPGGGSFKLMRYDPKLVESPNLLDYRNVCKLYLDRKVVGAFLIQGKPTDYVNQKEKAGEFWSVSGPGLRAWFHDAVVEPYRGIRTDSQSARVFSFASERGSWYNEADWLVPVVIQQYNMDPNSDPFGTAPAEWPDAPTANWIWGVDNDAVTSPAPEGVNYFRHEFTIAPEVGTKSYSIFAAAKDDFDIYLDGQIVIESRELNGYAKTWRADFELSTGDHILAARVRANGNGQAGLIAALFRAGDAATETAAELISVTDPTWVVNPYPDPAPGWTPGEIVLTLLAEAEARGVRFPTFLTPTFTATHDSNGAEWSRSLDWSFNIGTEYFDVLERLEELVCDAWIDPNTLELNLYAVRGTHRDTQSTAVQPVKFEIGRNVIRAAEDGESKIKNSLLMNTTDGWQSVADGSTGSIAKYGRVEGYVSTGASSSVSSDIAQQVFQQRAEPETSSTYDIIDVDDARPHSDFYTGDWVLAPSADDENTLAPRRVMSIAVAEDSDTGKTTFAVEFDTIFQDRAMRYDRWMKTAGDGTLGGTLANVSVGGGGGGSSPTTQNTATGPPGLQGVPGPVGMTWRGPWSAATEYTARDVVQANGSTWIAVAVSTNVPPTDVAPEWQLVAAEGGDGPAGAGLSYRGEWSSITEYVPNDLVTHSDSQWITSVTSTNSEPGISTDWELYAGGGGSDLPGRQTAATITASLPSEGMEQGLIPLAKGYRIYQITTDRPARVRLYGTAAKQSADSARPVGTDPSGDHGLIFEYVTTNEVLSAHLSPLVDGASFETIPTNQIPITITNLDSTTATVQVDLVYTVTEQ